MGRCLDGGGLGIVGPMVNTADDAKKAADAMRFPPIGTRSWGWGRAARYGANYTDVIDNEVFDDTTGLPIIAGATASADNAVGYYRVNREGDYAAIEQGNIDVAFVAPSSTDADDIWVSTAAAPVCTGSAISVSEYSQRSLRNGPMTSLWNAREVSARRSACWTSAATMRGWRCPWESAE